VDVDDLMNTTLLLGKGDYRGRFLTVDVLGSLVGLVFLFDKKGYLRVRVI